jgi:2-oxoglutarate ferredoxin oxidoreductase subunit delta
VIAERCKECGFCIDFCPKDLLEESDERNKKGYKLPKLKKDREDEKGYKLPKLKKDREDECIACRHCEDICPEFGLYIEEIGLEDEEEEEKEDE